MQQDLISKKDVELIGDHIDDIIKQAKKRQMTLIEPYEDEINKVTNIILDYIKKNKRKIYGGFALNFLISDKNPDDAIYTKDDIPDIDFYSPEPLKDLVKLCNELYNAGFKNVMGREALHKETYSIRVNGQAYCDITYVPKNIYYKLPFREINGFQVIGPEFMMIDYYRMMTDLISYWRLEKAVKRFYLLQKYYPLPYVKYPIDIPPSEYQTNVNILLDNIFNFLQTNQTCIAVGFYAYDHFLKNSGILNAKTATAKKFKYLEVPYYEIVTSEYKKDAMNLINILKKNTELADDIHPIENYPFFQFLGYSVYIYYKNILIAKVFSNNKRCVPFITVPSDHFTNGNYTKGTDVIKIGTISTVILYSLITVIKARVDQDDSTKKLYYAMISHITEMKNYYLNTNGKTIYDDTIFKEFVIECKGIPITPEHEKQQLIAYRKKKNKKLIYSYDPSEGIKPDDSTYRFFNSSGNPIKNIKNLKLTGEATEEESEEDTEDQDNNSN